MVISEDQMISNRELYAAQIQLIVHAEATSWNRLYNFLMGNTILVLAWATIYASSHRSLVGDFVLSAICIMGAASGIAWSKLGVRSRRILDEYMNQARAIEGDSAAWEKSVKNESKPITRTHSFTGEASKDEVKCISKEYETSSYLLKCTPCAFTIFYVFLLLATWFDALFCRAAA